MGSKLFKLLVAGSIPTVPLILLTTTKGSPFSLVSNSIIDTNENILKLGTTDKKLIDILKDYLKTYSGAKNLSGKFSEIFILNFLNSLNKDKYSSSAIKSKFQELLSEVNSKSEQSLKDMNDYEKKKALQMFGGDEASYRFHKRIEGLKEKFLDKLLPELNLNIDGEETMGKDKFKSKETQIKLKSPSNTTDIARKRRDTENKNEISFENSSTPDELKKKFSNFFQFIFEDYVKYERPLPFQKLTWKYDTGTDSEAWKEYKKHIPKDKSVLPESPNYYFPAFKKETDEKFGKFLEKMTGENEFDHTKLNEYTDLTETHFTVPISSIYQEKYSSQFNIAILNLYSDFLDIHKKQIKDAKKEEIENNTSGTWGGLWSAFSSVFSGIRDNITKVLQDKVEEFKHAFEKIKIDVLSNITNNNTNANYHCSDDKTIKTSQENLVDATNGKLLAFFCINARRIEKSFEPTAAIEDFYKISPMLGTGNSDKKNEQWLLYRDKEGVHAIAQNHELQTTNSLEDLKKILLIQAFKKKNNLEGGEKYAFDLFSELKQHLKKHFDRLFLSFYDQLSDKDSENTKTSNDNQYKDIIPKITEFLLSTYYSKNIFEIRKSLIRDYAKITLTLPVGSKNEKGEDSFSTDASIGLSGKFPYALKYSDQEEPKDYSKSQQNQQQPQQQQNQEETPTYLIKELEEIYTKLFDELETKKSEENKNTQTPTFFLLTKIKDAFKSYESQIDSFFSTNENKLTSKAKHYQGKKTVHFVEESSTATVKRTKRDTKSTTEEEKLTPSLNNLMEHVWITALENQKIENLLIQQQLKNGIKNYFDFDSKKYEENKEIDNSTKLDLFANGQNNSNRNKRDNNNDKKLSKEIVKNYVLEKNLKTFLSFPTPHIFGNWKYEQGKEDESLYKLFKAIEYEKKYLHSPDGNNLIDDANKDLFTELFTIDWLSKNKFENLRLYLSQKIKKNSFNAFLFSQHYAKEQASFCGIKNKDVTENDLSGFEFRKNINGSMHHDYLNPNNEDNKNNASKTCGNLEENYNFSAITFKTQQNGKTKREASGQEETKSKILTGYKGIINEDSKVLPEAIMQKVLKNKILWKSMSSITNEIDDAKTFKELRDIIDQLKKQFPKISWDFISLDENFKPKNFNFDWRSSNSSYITTQNNSISLYQKKQILKNYLSKNNKQVLIDRNMSWRYIEQKQAEFMKLTADNKLIKDTKFNNYFGVAKENRNFLLEADGDMIYKVFLIQIKNEDLTSSINFQNYLKTIHSDLLIKELIKAAQDKTLQKRAISEKLLTKSNNTGSENGSSSSADSNNDFQTIEIYDERLKEIFTKNWIIR